MAEVSCSRCGIRLKPGLASTTALCSSCWEQRAMPRSRRVQTSRASVGYYLGFAWGLFCGWVGWGLRWQPPLWYWVGAVAVIALAAGLRWRLRRRVRAS